MRRLRILALATTLAAANCVPAAVHAQEQPSYARHLNAEDMRVLAAFYGTATGAKMLQAMPKVLPEAFASVLPRMQPMLTETQDSFLKLLRERGLLN